MRRLVAFAAIACGVLCAIGPMPRVVHAAAPASHTGPTTLTVFAAASLTDAFDALGHQFEKSHPGVKVRTSFAGSQQLVAQLAAGAGADVFASADTRSMDDAARQGSLDGEPRTFVRNRLAVVTPAQNPGRIDRLADLAKPGTKLVICAPTVPAGRYTRELLANLSHAGMLPADAVARILANVVSEEDNVRAVLGKVRLGEADAGVVYHSDVVTAGHGKPRELAVPDSLNPVATYPIAVVRGAPAGPLAREFVEFVCGAAGQQVLVRYGFLPATAAATTP